MDQSPNPKSKIQNLKSVMPSRIYTAAPEAGAPMLGRTLPSMLYHTCAQYPNPRAFNQPEGDGWQTFSFEDFRIQSEETALGLLGCGFARGDRVAFLMESDFYFCVADMGCLLAGLIDVPIYMTHAPEAIQFVMAHAEARALFVSNIEGLAAIAPLLSQTQVTTVIVVEIEDGAALPALPEGVGLLTLTAIRTVGRTRLAEDAEAVPTLLDKIDAHDLATIIYTSGTTGQPKGVMLTHENISFNALTSYNGLTDYKPGADGEVGLSFLPLTHVFARTLHYGYMAQGTSIYFTKPSDLSRDLPRVRPTFFASVPRVLEKVYTRILERAAKLEGMQNRVFNWSLGLARKYEIGKRPRGFRRLQLRMADRLVFKRWRDALGGRVKYIICGGAALHGELANLFAAAGVTILQGYGLSETSPVITFNYPGRNRAGTVGEPIPGVEVMIADDGEILTRGPHVMKGYFRNEEKTREVIDAEGWFHTGDIGEFSVEGFLRITDRKKDLFKLSTGKYVIPQPLENRLKTEPLVAQAVVVGVGQKFASALIFPDFDGLRLYAAGQKIDTEQPTEAMLQHPAIRACYQELVDRANEGMDHWSTIKRFRLVAEPCTIENGLLTPTLKVKRPKVSVRFAAEIKALYVGTSPIEAL